MNILNKKKYIEYIIKIKYIIYNYIEIFNAKNEILIINLEIYIIFKYLKYFYLHFLLHIIIYAKSQYIYNFIISE